jgi:uncharacterized membrane protein
MSAGSAVPPLQASPGGYALPPLAHLAVLLAAALAVGAVLWRVRPRVTEPVVAALAPWMVAGSGLYVLYQVGGVPPVVAPLLGSPTVYLSVAVLAGAVWTLPAAAAWPADRWALPSTPGALAVGGVLGAAAVVLAVLAVGVGRHTLELAWPTVGLAVAVVLGAAVWAGLRRVRPGVRVTGSLGALTVLGHALDGVSTAVGYDVLGFGEQSPVSRAVLEAAAALPSVSLLGAGWLFVLLKLALAAAVVVLLAGYVREEPAEGYLLLGAVAAVGLGPGVHNLLLFAVA